MNVTVENVSNPVRRNNRCECLCQIAGELYTAMFDTGASVTAGSFKLYNRCRFLGIPMFPDTKSYNSVSGTIQGPKFRVELEVQLVGRTYFTPIVLFPRSCEGSEIILGIDFIKAAEIVLEPYLDSWHFADLPSRRYKYLTYTQCTDTQPGEEPITYDLIKFQTLRVNDVRAKNPSPNFGKSSTSTPRRKLRPLRCKSNINASIFPKISAQEFDLNGNKITWKDIMSTFQANCTENPNQPSVSSDDSSSEL